MFYPRPTPSKEALVVLAMARPSTPWRGYENVVAALAKVKEAHPEVNIMLFGHDYLATRNVPFPYVDLGVIDDFDVLADIYATADIFFEGSDFQGFGRLTLEAMACRTACVLTDVGGVGEYARNGENCFTVPPRTPQLAAEQIIKLIEDDQLRETFAEEAYRSAQAFNHKLEARTTLQFFQEIQANDEPES